MPGEPPPDRRPPDPFEPLYVELDPPPPELPPERGDVPELEPFEDPLTEELGDPIPLDDLPEAPDVPGTADPFADEPDDWTLLERDRAAVAEAPGDRVVLPWSLRVEIPALAMEVPAILDPTRPDSEWVVPRPPEQDTLDVRVRLGTTEVRVTVKLRAGDDAGLRLGRDALGDRILVRSTP